MQNDSPILGAGNEGLQLKVSHLRYCPDGYLARHTKGSSWYQHVFHGW